MDCLVKSSQLIAVKIISNADAEVETFVATADVLPFLRNVPEGCVESHN